jgi:flagellar biosynthetic protein FliQ
MALQAAFWIAMPVLGAATVVSLLINIVQVMTSIQDTTVTTVPRLTAVGIILFVLTPWMLNHLVSFTLLLFADFRPYTH